MLAVYVNKEGRKIKEVRLCHGGSANPRGGFSTVAYDSADQDSSVLGFYAMLVKPRQCVAALHKKCSADLCLAGSSANLLHARFSAKQERKASYEY